MQKSRIPLELTEGRFSLPLGIYPLDLIPEEVLVSAGVNRITVNEGRVEVEISNPEKEEVLTHLLFLSKEYAFRARSAQ